LGLPIFGKVVAEWRRTGNNQVIWRVPNSVFPKIKKIKAVLVREFERVAFVRKGSIFSVVTSGEHPLPRETHEIIWVDISPKMLPFGIAKYRHLLTKDRYEIGFSGTITLRVGDTEVDVKKFLTKIVSSKLSLSYDELMEWLREGPLGSVFRGFLGKLTREDFIKMKQYRIANSIEPELDEELLEYGLKLVSINITGVAH